MVIEVPAALAESCRDDQDTSAWLEKLPEVVDGLRRRWGLTIGDPLPSQAAWVAPAETSDRSRVMLKVGMPHFEGRDELPGLRFWDGNGTVRVLDFDEDLGAMLLERCHPGTLLRESSEPEQDVVLAGLLRRLWLKPSVPHEFRPLSDMLTLWTVESVQAIDDWPDVALAREGLTLFEDLARTSPEDVLLATDLHAGNVLRAEREPWLVIDPKPFVGDPAYDATQHLLNCTGRLLSAPLETIRRYAELLEVDSERVRLWTFARAAASPIGAWQDETSLSIARRLAP